MFSRYGRGNAEGKLYVIFAVLYMARTYHRLNKPSYRDEIINSIDEVQYFPDELTLMANFVQKSLTGMKIVDFEIIVLLREYPIHRLQVALDSQPLLKIMLKSNPAGRLRMVLRKVC